MFQGVNYVDYLKKNHSKRELSLFFPNYLFSFLNITF